MTVPVVSITCITYNQELYIARAIESFLMQKTTFPFEIIIHDDASTDNTANIIREYALKYPDLIFPIFQNENKWSKGINPAFEYVIPKCKGKYIAVCEGDDYWTDTYKLQKQVDFLEANSDFCIHHHGFINISSSGKLLNFSPERKSSTNIEDYLSGKEPYGPKTCTMMFRNDQKSIKEMSSLPYVCDTVLFVKFLSKGCKMAYSHEMMAAYRIHEGGIWSMQNQEKRTLHSIKTYESLLTICIKNKFRYNLFLQYSKLYVNLGKIKANYKEKIGLYFLGLRNLFNSNMLDINEFFTIRFIKSWLKTLIWIIFEIINFKLIRKH